jgi:hypothetical protein
MAIPWAAEILHGGEEPRFEYLDGRVNRRTERRNGVLCQKFCVLDRNKTDTITGAEQDRICL